MNTPHVRHGLVMLGFGFLAGGFVGYWKLNRNFKKSTSDQKKILTLTENHLNKFVKVMTPKIDTLEGKLDGIVKNDKGIDERIKNIEKKLEELGCLKECKKDKGSEI